MKRSLKDIKEKKLYSKYLKEGYNSLNWVEQGKISNMVGSKANGKETEYKSNERKDQHLKDFLRTNTLEFDGEENKYEID